jgi:hypothetical protein
MALGYCQACLDNGAECADPTNYCKFRPQCVIHELSKERRRNGASNGAQAGSAGG